MLDCQGNSDQISYFVDSFKKLPFFQISSLVCCLFLSKLYIFKSLSNGLTQPNIIIDKVSIQYIVFERS